MIDQNGELIWEEDQIYDGIRQDATESIRRYRVIKNAHFRNFGALTKDLGIRKIHNTVVSGGTHDTKAAMDLHWTEGTQTLAIIQGGSSTSTLHLWDSSTNEFGASKGVAIAAVDQPDMLLFANKLIILDGTTLRSMTSGGVMATPGEADYSNKSKFGAVYANRLIVAGNATFPYSFFPSGIRDSSSWDVDLSVDVTGLHGDAITCLGICGQFLIVGGRKFLRSYYLGTSSPKDWDWDEISNEVGPINHQSFQTVTRNGRSYAFFMSEEGPMMLAQQGGGIPALFPLWKPLDKAVRGIDHQGLTGLSVTNFDEVNTVYVPEYDEVRFACNINYSGSSDKPNGFIAVDLNSAIGMAEDANRYPFWRIRDNTISELHCSRVFPCRVDAATGRPSVTGQTRCMSARDGFVYEMDAKDQFVDDPSDVPIPFLIRKDGYDGREDGVRENSKSIQRLHVRTNQSGGGHRLYGRLITDGGQQASSISVDGTEGIPLDTGLKIWSTDTDDGTWGDGGAWNTGEFIVQRAGMHGVGKKFDLELFDDGNIRDEFQINSWSLTGMLEERR
jgi:hypothetical protein